MRRLIADVVLGYLTICALVVMVGCGKIWENNGKSSNNRHSSGEPGSEPPVSNDADVSAEKDTPLDEANGSIQFSVTNQTEPLKGEQLRSYDSESWVLCEKSKPGAADSVIGKLFVETSGTNDWSKTFKLAICAFDSKRGDKPQLFPLIYSNGGDWTANQFNSIRLKYVTYRQGDHVGYLFVYSGRSTLSKADDAPLFVASLSHGSQTDTTLARGFQGCDTGNTSIRVCAQPDIEKHPQFKVVTETGEHVFELWKISPKDFIPYDPQPVAKMTENTPYLIQSVNIVDTPTLTAINPNQCGAEKLGIVELLTDRSYFFVCDGGWSPHKNSAALDNRPGVPFTHVGVFNLKPPASISSFADHLTLSIRAGGSSAIFYVKFDAYAGSGGVTGATVSSSTWVPLCEGIASNCATSGELQARVVNGVPEARIVKSDNSEILIPLLALP